MSNEDAAAPPAPLPPHALATLCDVSGAILGVAGFDGRLRWVNRAFQKSYGYSAEELLAVPYLELIHPDDRDTVVALLADLAETGDGPSVTVRVRHRDGSWRWFRSMTTVVDDLVYFSGLDLTEDRAHAEELARANATLRLFGAGMAHDLRSLMTVIQGGTHELVQLARTAPHDPDLDALCDTLSSSADRAAVFVQALFSVGRRDKIERARFDVGDAVAGAVDDVAASLDACGGRIDWPSDLPAVWANLALVRATLTNLFANSIRYRRADVAPRIEVSAVQDGDRARIEVADNGIGIPEADLEKVFEPFTQAVPAEEPDDEVVRPSGQGLGLALCREMVAANGGTISATSELGVGTTVTIELPTRPSSTG